MCHALQAAALTAFIKRAFEAAGLPAGDADILAGLMVEADLRGSDTHGVIRLPLYLRRLKAGGVNPRPNIRIVREKPATALVDGDNGMGHLVMRFAAMTAIEKARQAGVGWVGARMSNHAGPAALYAMMPLAHDMIGLYLAVGSNNHLPPWGSTENLLGTNPIAIAIPAEEEPPIVLDMAPTVAAFGKVRLKMQRGEEMPVGWMIDRNGKPLTDPKHAEEGLLLPIGDYKGYGLEPDHRASRRHAQRSGVRTRGHRFRQGARQRDQYRPCHRRGIGRSLRAGGGIQASRRCRDPDDAWSRAAARRRSRLVARRAEPSQAAGSHHERHSHAQAVAQQPRYRGARSRHRAACLT